MVKFSKVSEENELLKKIAEPWLTDGLLSEYSKLGKEFWKIFFHDVRKNLGNHKKNIREFLR